MFAGAAFLARHLGALAGWRRVLAALLLGALGALAFPPVDFFPAFFLAILGLYGLVQGQETRRRAFAVAWIWGLGHNVAGNFWIANSFLIDPARFGWMIPPIIGGLAAYLALYPALVGALIYRRGDYRPLRLVAFAGLWVGAEMLRGHFLTGYPWNPAASIWDGFLPMLQSASLWGAFGLGFPTLLIAGAPAVLAGGGKRSASFYLAFIAALWAGLAAFGFWRLSHHEAADVAGVRLRLVQPNFSQSEKSAADALYRLVALTRNTPGFDQITHVIWPESAANFAIERADEKVRAFMGLAAPQGGALVMGTLRADPPAGAIAQIWNSLAVLDRQGDILATADKFHLVPLGEYVPLRKAFPFINKLTPGDLDFSAAAGPQIVSLPAAPPAGALICYEVIFPGAVIDPAHRPQWLINLTNDGWFGNSPGPYQHFAAARLRAIEEGLPLIRAANTGISGAIDPLGRIRAMTGLARAASLDVALPRAIEPTLFARWPVLFPMLFFGLGLLALIGSEARRRRQSL